MTVAPLIQCFLTTGGSGMMRIVRSSEAPTPVCQPQDFRREVSEDDVQQYAKSIGARVFVTSAQTGVGVAVRGRGASVPSWA